MCVIGFILLLLFYLFFIKLIIFLLFSLLLLFFNYDIDLLYSMGLTSIFFNV